MLTVKPEATVIIWQFQTNHLFNGFFLLSYRQAGRNKFVYWDLVYKDEQQYTENIQV